MGSGSPPKPERAMGAGRRRRHMDASPGRYDGQCVEAGSCRAGPGINGEDDLGGGGSAGAWWVLPNVCDSCGPGSGVHDRDSENGGAGDRNTHGRARSRNRNRSRQSRRTGRGWMYSRSRRPGRQRPVRSVRSSACDLRATKVKFPRPRNLQTAAAALVGMTCRASGILPSIGYPRQRGGGERSKTVSTQGTVGSSAVPIGPNRTGQSAAWASVPDDTRPCTPSRALP
jgi:hypothetical protein